LVSADNSVGRISNPSGRARTDWKAVLPLLPNRGPRGGLLLLGGALLVVQAGELLLLEQPLPALLAAGRVVLDLAEQFRQVVQRLGLLELVLVVDHVHPQVLPEGD